MRANVHFLTFSQSKTVICFILLVLQILSLSLKLNICIHKNIQCTFLVIYYLWYDASSLASFLVLGAGGGGQDPKCSGKKYIYLYCASERSERTPKKHIFSWLKIHLHSHIQCSILSLLIVWHYKQYYTDKTLTLRKIYEYASELRKFSHFHILNLLFPSIFCWYFVSSETHSFSGLQ